MFTWEKKGKIWSPPGDNKWLQEYAQNPNALELSDKIRIYSTSRKKSEKDGMYVSYISFVDVDKTDPSKIIYVHDRPALNLGGRGDFDEFGTMPGSVLHQKNKSEIWLYYVGWTRSHLFPYKWANGLAISYDGGVSFEKKGDGPIVSPSYHAPYLQACPRVWKYNENEWLIWYASGVEWYEYNDCMNPIYVIMSGASNDGIHWKLHGKPIIPSIGDKECQSSASVIEYNGVYYMFFSYRHVPKLQNRHREYRIGCAWSDDLVNWHRNDAMAGIDVSGSGWDSEAICYPHVQRIGDKVYMFYSGNHYGRSGFGYAELAE